MHSKHKLLEVVRNELTVYLILAEEQACDNQFPK